VRKRGELDKTPAVVRFADELEAAVLGIIEDGIVTKDLVGLVEPRPSGYESTEGFIDKAAAALAKRLDLA
jgi:isocitrate dehydrogenase